MPIDPICGMRLPEDSKALTSTHRGKTFYFCSDECKEEFDSDPGFYMSDQMMADSTDDEE